MPSNNEQALEDFYNGVKNIVLVGIVLMIIWFARFCVLWIGSENNSYMMIDLPFFK